MLPNSTERAVTVSGGSEALTQCIYNICTIMAESPPKGPTIPFKPTQFSVPPPASPTSTAAAAADAAAAAAAAAAYASPPPPGPLPALEPLPLMPHHHMYQPLMAASQFPVGPCLRYTTVPLPHGPTAVFSLVSGGGVGGATPDMGKSAAIYCPAPLDYGKGALLPPAMYPQINGLGFGPGVLSPAALASLAGSGGCRTQNLANSHQTQEMTVPNEIIGCVIGKGGSKIAEIRQISGAMIRISNCEDRDAPANLDRTITISGNCESVALAQYLINMRISMETAGMAGLPAFQYVSPSGLKAPVH